MKRLVLCLAFLWPGAALAQTPWISETPNGGIELSRASVLHDPDDAPVVAIAARDLADDIGLVTGRPAGISAAVNTRDQIWIGTAGHSALIARAGLDLSPLKDCWECYLIATVDNPAPGVDKALVIAGSDRRGTAYGVYELSRAVGVSPWLWWADVTPLKKEALYVAPGMRRFGPPSVRYRGIFINDEDWGLEPWAREVFDPNYGDIGPKTYEQVFRLMLRLRANTLWPAMHEVTNAFNADPANAALADRYAIVMGSSHAEPMLRNNVGEWTDAKERFNYAVNAGGIQSYWRERLKANGRYENHYSLGIRGIHDSGMVGADTREEKRDLLNRVLADQRELLAQEVGPPEGLPQMFVPYKEVLDIYRDGLELPEDVTVVWPDDNFGYIRQFPDAAERGRSGGAGVYYHLSYLGAPLAYLWLSTTPPALIKAEMIRAYDHGADRLWIANAGDIKPAEVSLTYFLDLAWDVEAMRGVGQREWLDRFAAETFGGGQAQAIGGIWDDYFRLNFIRRPEHLQWNYEKGSAPRSSPWRADIIDRRVGDFHSLSEAVDAAASQIEPTQSDAWFQLVEYPVKASALANRRYFALECLHTAKPCRERDEAKARAADAELKALTARFDALNGGKWRNFINEEPADAKWSFRLRTPLWPGPGVTMAATPVETVHGLPLGRPSGWTRTDGMGRDGGVVSGTTAAVYETALPPGQWRLRLSVLPTFPADGAPAWQVKVRVNDRPEEVLSFDRSRMDAYWSQGVLGNRISAESAGSYSGQVTVRITPVQPDLLLEGVEFVKN